MRPTGEAPSGSISTSWRCALCTTMRTEKVPNPKYRIIYILSTECPIYCAQLLKHQGQYKFFIGPYSALALEVYGKLRDGIVNNVMKEYYRKLQYFPKFNIILHLTVRSHLKV